MIATILSKRITECKVIATNNKFIMHIVIIMILRIIMIMIIFYYYGRSPPRTRGCGTRIRSSLSCRSSLRPVSSALR
jgi:hypothetical protein